MTKLRRGRQEDGSSDRRWVLLTESGQYATLGRASDPSEDDIRRAEDGLRARGQSGWLTVMSGTEYGDDDEVPDFIEIRRLAEPSVTFTHAVEKCVAAIKRRRAGSLD